MAGRLGDPQALLVALYARHWATLAPDLLGVRLANAAQMLDVAMTVGDEEAAFLARHARLHCLLERCDVAGVDAELEAMADLADRTRQPFHRWRTANARAMRALLEGRLEEAERRARGALEIGGLRQSEYVTYLFEHALLVAIRWMQGRLGELQEAIRFHGERYSSLARWRNALVAVELADERAARAEVERHALRDFTDRPRDGLWLLHLRPGGGLCPARRRASGGAALRAAVTVCRPQRDLDDHDALRAGRAAAWDGGRHARAVGGGRTPLVAMERCAARCTGDHGPCPVRALTDAGRPR